MEILLIVGLLIALIGIVIVLAIIGALWIVYLLLIAGLVLIWVVGLGAGIMFVVAVFIGSLVWETFKYFREKRRLENVEELNVIDNEP